MLLHCFGCREGLAWKHEACAYGVQISRFSHSAKPCRVAVLAAVVVSTWCERAAAPGLLP